MSATARIEAAAAEAVAGGLPGVVLAARLADGEIVETSAVSVRRSGRQSAFAVFERAVYGA